jgi:Zn-dependent protease with chaperone function
VTRNPITNQAANVLHFCYHQTMTIGITGPERKVPRQSAVVGFIIAAVFAGICLILLWLASDFLVDWLFLDRLSAGFLDNNRR